VIKKTIAVIIPMNLNVEMLLVLLRNLLVKMAVAFQTSGSAILRMIAAMVRMKEISVLRRLALTSSSRVRGRVIVFRSLGCVMAMTIVSINR
jgi:hypothetical protein